MHYQKHDVTYEHFGRDATALVAAITAVRHHVRPQTAEVAPHVPWGWVGGWIGAVAIVVAVAYYAGERWQPGPSPTETRAKEAKEAKQTAALTASPRPNSRQTKCANTDQTTLPAEGGPLKVFFDELMSNSKECLRIPKLGMSVEPDGKDVVVVGEIDSASDAAEKRIKSGDVILEVSQENVKIPGDVFKAVNEATTRGRRSLLMRVRSANEDPRYVVVFFSRTSNP